MLLFYTEHENLCHFAPGNQTMKQSASVFLSLLAIASWVQAQPVNPTLPNIPANNFLVTSYGAVGDGSTTNTAAIASAIAAAVGAGGGTVEFPAAAHPYLSGPIILSSSINLQVDSGAELQMLPYGKFPTTTTNSDNNIYTFIFCKNVTDVEICGGGVIDGQGQGWWNVLATNGGNLPPPYNGQANPPMLLDLFSCDRLFIHDITFQNAPYHHCGIRNTTGNVTISNLTESAASTSPNTDGIDFVGTNCLIEKCNISVGDDNIALGSTGPLNGLVITNCTFGNGHGVSIGSTVTDGITNVTVANCSFNATANGIRIKCNTNDPVIITNLNYLNLSMTNVGYPIVLYTYYDVSGESEPDNVTPTTVLASQAFTSGNPKVGGILISNLNITNTGGSSETEIIWGPKDWPFTNLTLACVTNNSPSAPGSMEIYNAYGVQIINSQFNYSSGSTFTFCNAGVAISNPVPGGPIQTITGGSATNSLALYNTSASMSSSIPFTANPITISGGTLTTTNGALSASTTQNFFIGTNSSTIAVTGNLTLNSTVNVYAAGGFAAGSYVLFTYTGSESGSPSLGATPAGFEGYTCSLSNNATARQVLFEASPPSSPSFTGAVYVGSSGSGGSVVLTGAGGVAGGNYNLLTSTNLLLPLSQWTPVATNQFDSGGNFIFTNLVPGNVVQQYFYLQIPEP